MKVEYRKQGRNVLSNLFTGTGVEVGTESGKYAEQIAQSADKLYCVDLWKNYPGYREHVSDAQYEEIYQNARRRLDKYDVGFIRTSSQEAAKLFLPEHLDFVYLDANHTYEHVLADLQAWYPTVRSGGILAGHDYLEGFGKKDGSQYGVIRAVNEFCKLMGIPDIVVWTADSSPSWHLIKPCNKTMTMYKERLKLMVRGERSDGYRFGSELTLPEDISDEQMKQSISDFFKSIQEEHFT